MASEFSIGQEVRVLSEDNTSACRGTILLDNGNGTFEVLLSKSSRNRKEVETTHSGDDEVTASAEKITALHPFELQEPVPLEYQYADVWKGNGNTLFASKDYQEAMHYYRRALVALQVVSARSDTLLTFEMGENVIITSANSIDCYPGMISETDNSARTADVMLDSDNEEQLGVPYSDLMKLTKTEKDLHLQRSIYLNMARCALKLNQRGWAIKYASIAIAVTFAYAHSNGGKSGSEINKLLADCYYFRSKALLAACRPKFASKDCKYLMQYDSSKATILQKEIQAYKERTARSNRKLARDIASWVSTAMSAQQKGDGISGSGGEDLEVLEEEDEEDGEDNRTAKCAKEKYSLKDSKLSLPSTKTASTASTKAASLPSTSLLIAVLVVCAAVLSFIGWKR